MAKLAINGGTPVKTNLFPAQETIGKREEQAVLNVMKNKHLSYYRGSWNDSFYGGPEIKKLEDKWENYHSILYALAVNSCTSALQIACGSIDLQPGDEVIVTPWSMSCSATAPMIYGATPVFADIEYDYYCLDVKSIEEKITSRTKAIIVVDLFGQPYNYTEINKLAEKHNLFIIEDAAQAIGSKGYDNKYAGTFGDMGTFSLTQGKHLTSGEGGILISNDKSLNMKNRLIANHAEAVVNDMQYDCGITQSYINKNNMIGFNMRMTEIQAAIARIQLSKLNNFVQIRQKNAKILNAIDEIPCIKSSPIRKNCTHSYYVQAFKFYKKIAGIHRNTFIDAVKAELTPEKGRANMGVALGCGYIQPLYRMPLFQNQIRGNYKKGLCPITEKLWKDELFLWRFQSFNLEDQDRQDIINAFWKVWDNRDELKD